MILDYEKILDQILDTNVLVTESFILMLKSIQRIPWWVLILNQFLQAKRVMRTKRGLQKIVNDGNISLGKTDVVFDRCILLLDQNSRDACGDAKITVLD